MQSDGSVDDFHLVSYKCPSLLVGVLKFGEPFTFLPPTWRSWKVEHWRFYSQSPLWSHRWELDGTYWISSLADLETFYDRLPSTGSSYMYKRLHISCWLWDYAHRQWYEETCL
jgi:hypothetical protein